MSVGITLILTLQYAARELVLPVLAGKRAGSAAASVAAVLHLAHPDRAYNALINLQHAWLSREIRRNFIRRGGGRDVFGKRAQSAGCSGLCSPGDRVGGGTGMTYAAPAMVAIANGLTMLLFFITVWVMGCAAIPLLNLAPAVAALRQDCRLYGGHDCRAHYLAKAVAPSCR